MMNNSFEENVSNFINQMKEGAKSFRASVSNKINLEELVYHHNSQITDLMKSVEKMEKKMDTILDRLSSPCDTKAEENQEKVKDQTFYDGDLTPSKSNLAVLYNHYVDDFPFTMRLGDGEYFLTDIRDDIDDIEQELGINREDLMNFLNGQLPKRYLDMCGIVNYICKSGQKIITGPSFLILDNRIYSIKSRISNWVTFTDTTNASVVININDNHLEGDLVIDHDSLRLFSRGHWYDLEFPTTDSWNCMLLSPKDVHVNTGGGYMRKIHLDGKGD